MFSTKKQFLPPQVEEVFNPIHEFSLKKYFKKRQEREDPDGVLESGEGDLESGEYEYNYEVQEKGKYRLYITFFYNDDRLKTVTKFIHLVDLNYVNVTDDKIVSQFIDEFNNPLSDKDKIIENIISYLKGTVPNKKVPIKKGGNSRRRVQTKKKKRKQHKKKYSTKKRK